MEKKRSTNVVWSKTTVTKEKRQRLNNHRSTVLWFTGLSGAGKSTLANHVEARLHALETRTYLLDGDNVRHGLTKDLGFNETDRTENIRRIGEVAKLFVDAGTIVLTAFISPFRSDRAMVRKLLGPSEFIEIFVECPVSVCETRDVKGLYKRARAGEIPHFTGVDSPYEPPETPELVVPTADLSIDDAADTVIRYLVDNDYVTLENTTGLGGLSAA